MSEQFEERVKEIYKDKAEEMSRSLHELIKRHSEIFPNDKGRDISLFTAPARTEICGNHTDHQNGKVIAAAIDIDMRCAACPNGENVIRVNSQGYAPVSIDLTKLHDGTISDRKDDISGTAGCIQKDAGNGTEALLYGIISALSDMGYEIKGFDALIESDIPSGCGMSSSAAYEVIIGSIVSELFNDGNIPHLDIAKAGRTAENSYMGKPSGLLDQLACLEGGVLYMDLKDPECPELEKLSFDPKELGCAICLVDTGSSHEDLTDAYAQIKEDMSNVAGFFGKKTLREVSEDEIEKNFMEIVGRFGERAVKRVIHFVNEEERVDKLKQCIAELADKGILDADISEKKTETETEDPAAACDMAVTDVQDEDEKNEDGEEYDPVSEYLKVIVLSGQSSFRDLNNVCLPGKAASSNVVKALDMSWELLAGHGAFRIHGGGFEGTVQAYVPLDRLSDYISVMDETFGKGACHVVHIRDAGACRIK